jgi:hypothetical protein
VLRRHVHLLDLVANHHHEAHDLVADAGDGDHRVADALGGA